MPYLRLCCGWLCCGRRQKTGSRKTYTQTITILFSMLWLCLITHCIYSIIYTCEYDDEEVCSPKKKAVTLSGLRVRANERARARKYSRVHVRVHCINCIARRVRKSLFHACTLETCVLQYARLAAQRRTDHAADDDDGLLEQAARRAGRPSEHTAAAGSGIHVSVCMSVRYVDVRPLLPITSNTWRIHEKIIIFAECVWNAVKCKIAKHEMRACARLVDELKARQTKNTTSCPLLLLLQHTHTNAQHVFDYAHHAQQNNNNAERDKQTATETRPSQKHDQQVLNNANSAIYLYAFTSAFTPMQRTKPVNPIEICNRT